MTAETSIWLLGLAIVCVVIWRFAVHRRQDSSFSHRRRTAVSDPDRSTDWIMLHHQSSIQDSPQVSAEAHQQAPSWSWQDVDTTSTMTDFSGSCDGGGAGSSD